MVEPLDWDTAFFGRRMGVLTGDLRSADAIAAAVTAARAGGFEYVQCRPPVDDAVAIRALTRAGFYLTDVGATWAGSSGISASHEAGGHGARLADEHDIPWLEADAVQFFRLSRFYHDPFFSTADADRLHAAWIANSVRGLAAAAVWVVPDVGFVTCKLLADGGGEVGLIGVRPGARGRGAGRALMAVALDWFRSRGIAAVRVKTQVRNLQAMNFYHRLGFDLQSTDLTMGCVLHDAPDDHQEAAL